LEARGWEERERLGRTGVGGGTGEVMIQTLYAHMNKRNNFFKDLIWSDGE
jgi:hypothetical protein